MPEHEENPVVSGFVALVTVAIVVGLLAGIGALFATNLIGIGEGSDLGADTTGGETLYMPSPVATEVATGPLVTLYTPEPTSTSTKSKKASPSPSETEDEDEKPEITLSQGAFEVGSGEQLYLSGIYPIEGAVLDIEQRVNDGAWQEFPVDVNVSGGTFAVYVKTSATGSVEWRLVDKSRNVTSNVVKVQHG